MERFQRIWKKCKRDSHLSVLHYPAKLCQVKFLSANKKFVTFAQRIILPKKGKVSLVEVQVNLGWEQVI